MRVAQLVPSAVLLTVLGGSLASTQQPKFAVLPCSAMFGHFDPQTHDIARCGTVTVPQDRALPNDPALQSVVLPVIVYTAPSAHGTPVLYLAGGPGESVIDGTQRLVFQTPLGQLLLRERSIITFDRRGSSGDEPRSSPELGAVEYASRPPRGTAVATLRDTVSRLAKAWHGHGVEARNFTTLPAAEDIADVLHALGIPRVIVIGASYGTREAFHFLRRHPEMVESMVLDGVAPPNATTLLDSATIVAAGRAVVLRILEDCQKDDGCNDEYEDLRRAVDWLSADSVGAFRRTANYGSGWRTLETRGAAILSIVGMASTWEPIRAEAPHVLLELATQDTLRTSLAARVLMAASADPTLTGGRGEPVPLVRFIAFCGDRPQGEPFGGDRQVCDALNVPFSGPEAITRVTSDAPILLISSGYDVQTPPYFADDAARTLPHSQRVFFPMVGHLASVRGTATSCAAIIVESFMAQPDRAPAAGCVSSVVPAFAPRRVMTPQKAPR